MTLALVALTILFTVTGYDFLASVLPPELGLIPLLAAAGMGLGALVWEFAGHRHAKCEGQATIALIMVFVNLGADGMAFIGEVLRAGNSMGMPPWMANFVLIGVIGVLVANVMAGALYRIKDPTHKTAREAAMRAQEMADAQAEAEAARMYAELEVLRQTAQRIRDRAPELAAQLADERANDLLSGVAHGSGAGGTRRSTTGPARPPAPEATPASPLTGGQAL